MVFASAGFAACRLCRKDAREAKEAKIRVLKKGLIISGGRKYLNMTEPGEKMTRASPGESPRR
jgi:hypothetical protein